MCRLRVRYDSLGYTVARGKNEIKILHTELLNGRGKDRQITAIFIYYAGQLLNERSFDSHPFDCRGYRTLVVQEGEDRGRRKHPAKSFEAFLAAAHAGKPIVYKRNFQLVDTSR